jgi:hypothetical protein
MHGKIGKAPSARLPEPFDTLTETHLQGLSGLFLHPYRLSGMALWCDPTSPVRVPVLWYTTGTGTFGCRIPKRKVPMRSLLAALLSFSFFASTTFAQQNSQRPARPAVPSALYECDGDDQCGNPRSGGAVWLFAGSEGQGMWRYQAVTKLTVVAFDGRTIHIHRVDPAGTYSSAFAKDHGEFIGDYFGTIKGNRIEGKIYFGGIIKPPGAPWHATIVGDDFCSDRAEECPLMPEQLSILGRRASEAKMYPAAFRCFELAAEQGDADGKGFEAEMMMNGWGGTHSPAEIMALLQESADGDSYPGEKALARVYATGKLVPKNPAKAAYWEDRANSRQARLEAQEQSQANAQMAGKVLGAAAIFGLLAIMVDAGSGSGDSSSSSEPQHNFQRENDMGYWYAHGGANGGPPNQ